MSNDVVASVAVSLSLDATAIESVVGNSFSVASMGSARLPAPVASMVDEGLNQRPDSVLVATEFVWTKVKMTIIFFRIRERLVYFFHLFRKKNNKENLIL